MIWKIADSDINVSTRLIRENATLEFKVSPRLLGKNEGGGVGVWGVWGAMGRPHDDELVLDVSGAERAQA